MIVVSDSSPLITLAKIKRLELLPQLYGTILITPQIYTEVVVSGSGMSGSSELAKAKWLEVQAVKERQTSFNAQQRFSVSMGYLSVIMLAKELHADVVLIDDRSARRIAENEGLSVTGCIGLLEEAFHRKLLADLNGAYRDLLASGAYLNRKLLEQSLKNLALPPLFS